MRDWAALMFRSAKMFMFDITPRIHSLPQCLYIRWLGYEWIIPKQ